MGRVVVVRGSMVQIKDDVASEVAHQSKSDRGPDRNPAEGLTAPIPHLSLTAARFAAPILRLAHAIESISERMRFTPSNPAQKLFIDAELVHQLREEQIQAERSLKHGNCVDSVLFERAIKSNNIKLDQLFFSYQRGERNLLADYEFDSARKEALVRMATMHESLKYELKTRLRDVGIAAKIENLAPVYGDEKSANLDPFQRLVYQLDRRKLSKESEFVVVSSSFQDDGQLQLVVLQPDSYLKAVKRANAANAWQQTQRIAQNVVAEAANKSGYELHFERITREPSRNFPYRMLSFVLRPAEIMDLQTIETLSERPGQIYMQREIDHAQRSALVKSIYKWAKNGIKKVLSS